jgi:hypothetical protein
MKKNTALLTLICIGLSASAQLTITNDDLIGPGNKFAQAEDANADATIIAGPAGSGKTWNFSALTATTEDTMFFVAPSSLPRFSDFSDATLGYYFGRSNDSTWAYIRSSGTELEVLGAVGVDESTGDTVSARLEFPLLTFPSSLGTTFTDNFLTFSFKDTLNFDPDGPIGPHPHVDSIRFVNTTQINSEIDAEGNITTPTGTFKSLRQRVERIFIDSSLMYTNGAWSIFSPTLAAMLLTDPVSADTTLSYRWWIKETGFPIVEFGVDRATDMVNDNVIWMSAEPETTVGISIPLATQIEVYPNPSSGKVIVVWDQITPRSPATFVVFDLSGKQVAQHLLQHKSNTITLKLPAGAYVYELISGNHRQSAQLLVK